MAVLCGMPTSGENRLFMMIRILRKNCQLISNQQYLISKILYMRRNSVFASTMLQLYSPTAARHADKYDAAVSVYTAYNDSHRNSRKYEKLIRKHPKIRRILRCESSYFHH